MAHQIDLTKLSIDELIELNRQIVARVKHLRQKESYQALAKFHLGDRVSFRTDRGIVEGTIVRLNKKTVTLHTDDHNHWSVSPQVLKKIGHKESKAPLNVLRLQPS